MAYSDGAVFRVVANVIAGSAWLIDQEDPTQRALRLGISMMLVAFTPLGWSTLVAQDASPSAESMRVFSMPDKPATRDPPRASLRVNAARLAEDLQMLLPA